MDETIFVMQTKKHKLLLAKVVSSKTLQYHGMVDFYVTKGDQVVCVLYGEQFICETSLYLPVYYTRVTVNFEVGFVIFKYI